MSRRHSQTHASTADSPRRRPTAGPAPSTETLLNRINATLFSIIPGDVEILYRLCRNYVDRYLGMGDGNPETNGERRLIEEYGPRSKIVVDVGANVGAWSAMVHRVNPNAVIYAFEPNAAAFDKLAANDRPNLIPVKVALGDARGTAELHLLDDAHSCNSLYARKYAYLSDDPVTAARRETVEVETLDDFCRSRGIHGIDLLKIDAEGHDLAVLRGALNLLAERRIRVVQFEYSSCNLDSNTRLSDFFALLSPVGYALHRLSRFGPRRVHDYHPDLENFRYQNWVAVADAP